MLSIFYYCMSRAVKTKISFSKRRQIRKVILLVLTKKFFHFYIKIKTFYNKFVITIKRFQKQSEQGVKHFIVFLQSPLLNPTVCALPWKTQINCLFFNLNISQCAGKNVMLLSTVDLKSNYKIKIKKFPSMNLNRIPKT